MDVHIRIGNHGGDESTLRREKECLGKLSRAGASEESNSKQKSRVQWLREENQNTAYLFNSIKNRINTNEILCLQVVEGNMVRGSKEIKDITVGFYQNFLGSDCPIPYGGSN